MGKKRRLNDLYRTHTIVECEDGNGDKIAVSLVKINRPDTDSCVAAANAKRARLLMRRSDKDSEVWLEAYGDIADREREELVAVLISDDLSQKQLSAEAEEETLERWAENEYLDGLRTLWVDELQHTWIEHPDDPEAKRAFDELKAFRVAVEKRMEGEAEDLAEAYSHVSDEDLKAKVVAKLIDNTANLVWIQEFEMRRVFYATRDLLDRTKRYFDTYDEVRDLDERIYTQLRIAYDGLALDVMEGKGPPATRGSSPPSEPSTEEEPSTPSGQETPDASKTSPTSS